MMMGHIFFAVLLLQALLLPGVVSMHIKSCFMCCVAPIFGTDLIPVCGEDRSKDDDFIAKYDRQQPLVQLEEFWSESRAGRMPWEERKWKSLYNFINLHR